MPTTAKRPIPAGGVEVTHHKGWNTKRCYTRSGYLARTYRRQPKRVRFRSRMVNDGNQHLCGGWTWFKDDNREIERRLVAGRKPLGSMHYWSEQEARAAAKRLKAAGLRTVVRPLALGTSGWAVDACHDIRVKDIGDLGVLIGDYTAAAPAFTPEFHDEFLRYGNRRLSSFLGGRWDVGDCPPWLTGLLLGYPVENTISLYHE